MLGGGGSWVGGASDARLTVLEGKYVRTSRFASIGSGTSGTLTLPSNSTIIENDFGGSGLDCVTSKISGGKPTFESAVTSGNVVITATLDTSGNYVLSSTPSSYPIALIFRIQQTQINFDSTASDIVGDPDYSGASLTSPTFQTSLTLNGYKDFVSIAAPSTPSASTLRVWSEDLNGFQQLHFKDPTGLEFQLARDNIHTIRNNSGATLNKGTWVYITGSTGEYPTVAKAKADSATTAAVVGLITADVNNNSFGRMMTAGDFAGIDTSVFIDGDVLYLSAATAGEATATPPTGANIYQRVGVVVKDSVGAGIIYVSIGGEIDPTLTQTLTNKTLTSPVLTATPSASNNSTAIASTAYVDNQINLGSPFKDCFLFEEDFTTVPAGLHYSGSGTGAGSIARGEYATPGHPGVHRLETGTTTTGYGQYQSLDSDDTIMIGGNGVTTYETVVYPTNVSDATDTFTFLTGMRNQPFLYDVSPANGIYFSYTHSVNGGNWTINCTKASATTSVDTGIAVAAVTWYRLTWVLNAAGTSLQAYVNGTAAGSAITTNIPLTTQKLSIFAMNKKSAGTASRKVNVDYVTLRVLFTTPR